MSNGLLYIAGFVSLVLAALFAVPYFIDWNGYRGVFEEEATRILGREVRVGGDVNVRLLPAPYVRFDKLRIADTTGTAGEPFFRAESFTMRLSVPPLLKGIIEANEIELKRPVLRLAVDAKGGGNWRTLSIAPGALPFVPSDVTLQSVKIKDGLVALHGPKGIGVAELEGLNGEFKADSIEGPFSFKGTAKWQGADRELRIATDVADAEGAVHFKATVHGTKRENAYTIDGRLRDLRGHPRIEGDVTAKLDLDTPKPAQPQAAAAQPAGEAAETPRVDFRSSFAGDAKGLRLDGITLSFERLGQPQLISGTASASWSDALSVELNLNSRWLDLDRIAGAGNTGGPFEIARSFVSTIMDSLPAQADTKVRFDLDQANLGGEAVSGLRVEVVRANGTLLLKELRAGLPGGSKLALYGTVGDSADARAFQGDLALRGTSLARFLKWAAKDVGFADDVRSDGPFALQGRLGMSAQAVDLVDAGGEIGGEPLTGEVHYRGGDRTRLGVVLQGQEIDGGRLWPAAVGYLKGILGGGAPAGANAPAPPEPAYPRWLNAATSDLSLRLRAGQLMTGRQPLRDVDMDIAVEQGRLAVRTCKFVTDDGLAVELEGTVADVGGDPHGALRWVFAAPDKNAFTSFVRLWDLPADLSKQAMPYVALAPMRLAGAIRLGERGKTSSDIHADGSIEGGRLVATARLDGGLGNWREANADLALTLDSSDVVQAFDNLTTHTASAPAEPRERSGEIFVKAVGVPASGLLTTATVKAPGLFFAYDGSVGLPADGAHTFNGDVRVSSRELGDILAIAGLGTGGALRGVPVIGTVKMTSASHAIELKPQQLDVAGSKVDGTIALAYPGDGPAIVTAQLQVDKATIPGLLSVALDRSTTAAVPAEPAAPGKPVAAGTPVAQGNSIWPESAFDFAALDGIEGKLGVSFDKLALDEGMAINKAQLEVSLAPGKIGVTKLEGSALGGNVVAAFALEQVPGGASLAGDVRLMGAHLSGAGKGKADDATASMALEMSGRGATPGGLIAVATGKGELTLSDMTMRVPTPLAVVATSEAVLTGAAGGQGEELTAALRDKFAASDVKVGPRKIAIDIADGAAKLEQFTLPSDAGTTQVTTTVDLSSLMVDSEWVLQPRAPDVVEPDKPRKGALPSVDVVYVGPLKDAWTLQPRVTADQLERELAIRKMELDADQLERLHKADAERARRDEERRRALESEQAPAPAPSAAAPPGAGTPGTPAAAQPEPQPGSAPPLAPSPIGNGDPGVEPGTAPTEAIPAVPGLEAQIPPSPPQGVGAAAAVPPNAADPAQQVPQAANRTRRSVRRTVPVGEQVLRALQNGTNY